MIFNPKFLCLAGLLTWNFIAQAQGQPPPPEPPSRSEAGAEGFILRMMVFDDNHDGKLLRSEITDERLLGLFDRADANHDGIVTKEELKALYAKESANSGRGGGPGGGFGGRGGPGRDNFRDNGNFGGRGGPGMRPQPGQIFSEGVQHFLGLTTQQKTALADIQKDVDAKVDKLLTPAQKTQLKEMQQRGPGGPPHDGPDGPPRP